jgi:hypothetical protein
LQATVLGRNPNPIKVFVETIGGVMSAKKGSNNSWIAELNTLWYVGFQPFFS